ncbi:hypothetical protein BDF14DRAFT_1813615 [Spinellus fusiger]|nr:hypothetical protein BDF14DRAFT_1813615 [Spinellus fusiger]
MLPSQNLFRQLACPDLPKCSRYACFYSHTLPRAPLNKRAKTSSSLLHAVTEPITNSQPKTRTTAHSTTQPISRMDVPSPVSVKKPFSSGTRPASNIYANRIQESSTERLTVPAKRPILSTERPTATAQNPQTLLSNRLSTMIQGPRRVAHTPTTSSAAGPPTILPNIRSHTPLKLRQTTVTKIYEHFCRIYTSHPSSLATEHALQQEEDIHQNTLNPTGYKQKAMTVLMSLKKRPQSTGPTDIGLEGVWIEPGSVAIQSIEKEAQQYRLTQKQLQTMGYPMPDILSTPGGIAPSRTGLMATCDRCERQYKVKDVLEPMDHTVCVYHHGRLRVVHQSGEKLRVYTCCEDSFGSEGCVKGPHVYKDEDFGTMHSKIAYVEAPARDPAQPRSRLVALDCEMGYTTAGTELIRLTVVGEHANLLMDHTVLPSHMVIDLNTRYSGISTLAGVKHNLESVRQELFKHIDKDTLLLGHGLENDMNALRMIHTNVLDTAALYPHPHGLPYRYGLRTLSTRYLSKFIQDGSDGHDSFQDAQTCMELLQVFLKTKKSHLNSPA